MFKLWDQNVLEYTKYTIFWCTSQEDLQALLAKHLMIPLFYSGIDKIAHDATLKHTNNVPIYGSVTETWWMDTDKPQKQD